MSPLGGHWRASVPVSVGLAAFALLCLGLVAGPSAEAAPLKGHLRSAQASIEHAPVRLYRTEPDAKKPVLLARGRSSRHGAFKLRYPKPTGDDSLHYLISLPRPGGPKTPRAVRLASALGTSSIPKRVVVNERTTVAAGFALAQFIRPAGIIGTTPGVPNAAGMAANLANPRNGGLGKTLRRPPNRGETLTLPTFNSLANMLAGCVRREARCGRLFKLTKPQGDARPQGTLRAMANVARDPAHRSRPLFKLSQSSPAPYPRALGATQRPGHWSLILRFDGDGVSLDGPGNFAIDGDGFAWVANNYTYTDGFSPPVCAGDTLPKFRPDGRYAAGSPFTGGGLSGAGYGITLDPEGHVWVGNFGFSSPDCPTGQPPANSVSELEPDGTPVSGDSGYTAGNISWPQGTVSDQDGNIWIANCGNDSATHYEDGEPGLATSITDFGPGDFEKPFDIAINHDGDAFVTANESSAVGVLNPDGTPKPFSPITTGGISRPMGIAADSRGNMWVANSGVVDPPCPPPAQPSWLTIGGSLTLIRSNGQVLSSPAFTGGGLTAPWGIAVDGADNVWVSNFTGQRVSRFCGLRAAANCPPSKQTGDPISPDEGYGFAGLTRNTAVQVDPSGNLWVTNNWKQVALPNNPGGYEVVIFVGAAAPLATPLIGPPEPAAWAR